MLERRVFEMSVAPDRRLPGDDRRKTPRYAAGGTVVILTWPDGDDYRTVAAELKDISFGGGSALVESAPPAQSTVWFRVRGDDTSPWIGATVVGVSRTGLLGRGPRFLRWRFAESCPYGIFKAAIDGFSGESQDTEFNRRNSMRSAWQ